MAGRVKNDSTAIKNDDSGSQLWHACRVPGAGLRDLPVSILWIFVTTFQAWSSELLLSLLFCEEIRGTDKLNNFPKVIRKTHGRVRIEIQASRL